MEKIIITLESESLPENMNFLEFNVTVVDESGYSRGWKNWRKIKIIRLPITKIEVVKD